MKFATWSKFRIPFVFAILALTIVFLANSYSDIEHDDVPHFPSELSPHTPYDVDLHQKAVLESKKEFDEVQRIFEILSWQMFIALNWPYVDDKPQPKITDEGLPLWDGWKESYEVYKEDGSTPAPWGESELPKSVADIAGHCEDIMYRTSKFAHIHSLDVADEIDQAFTAPIWDQNGNIVRYEVRMNEVEFDYVVANELYNLEGQIDFSKGKKILNFPSGDRTTEGSFEIKLAWKIINGNDPFADRYYTRTACVLNQDKTFSEATVGLIGMHIATKTKSSPQWIWATFEHVDNLEVNVLDEYNGHKLKPSFYDPNCQTCPINVFPDTSASVVKNQIQRVLPISMATQALNKEVQTLLGEAESPFQYYQLVGTQWPTDPKKKPYKVYPPADSLVIRDVPEAIINKGGGTVTPVYLTNMIMETYFQGATQDSNFNYLIANEPAWLQIEGFPKHTTELVFGTESCVGCHASASIAIRDTVKFDDKTGKYVKDAIFAPRYDYDSEVIADFSWLPQIKARFKDTTTVGQRY